MVSPFPEKEKLMETVNDIEVILVAEACYS